MVGGAEALAQRGEPSRQWLCARVASAGRAPAVKRGGHGKSHERGWVQSHAFKSYHERGALGGSQGLTPSRDKREREKAREKEREKDRERERESEREKKRQK